MGALKLRRGVVREAAPAEGPEQEMTVELAGGARRAARADVALVGACEVGDEVIVNTQALDLGLGSGGFDLVHVNLTRGLAGEGVEGAHVMKLNYSSLQHAVRPVEQEDGEGDGELALPLGGPVAALALHGQLAPFAWAYARASGGRRLGFVQTPGGALSGGHSRAVRELLARGLLAGHVTAGACYGGDMEAITIAGALHAGLGGRAGGSPEWDAAVCGPGPGIVGSASTLGHGGMQALDSAQVALAMGARTLVVARMSSGDARERHRGLSHHTRTVLELLLAPVAVAWPAGDWPQLGARDEVLDRAGERLARHDWREAAADLDGYAASGLPTATMGRTLARDELFFASALAAGAVLSEL